LYSVFVLVSFDSKVYAECPALSGQYLCQSESRHFQFEIQYDQSSDLNRIDYHMKESHSGCRGFVNLEETITIDLNESLDSIRKAWCFNNILIVPTQSSENESFSEKAIYSVDPTFGTLVRTLWRNNHRVEVLKCTPFRREIEVEAHPSEPLHKRSFDEFMASECETLESDDLSSPEGGQPPLKKQNRWVCEICSKEFAYRRTLSRHRESHTQDKRFQCETCGKKFTRSDILRDHKNTHTGATPYKCETCGKGFARQSNLITHRIVHTGIKPHVCGLCGSSFVHSGRLKDHEKLHQENKLLFCEICGNGFARQNDLTVHRKVHSKEKN
jgi:DNA-directed RNA polymerase subunit RPC12/RpoP